MNFDQTKKRTSFVLVKRDSVTVSVWWLTNLFLQFQTHARVDSIPEYYSCLRHMKATRPIDKVDDMLGFLCLRCTTEDNIDNSMLRIDTKGHLGPVSVGDWFGASTFASIKR